MLDAYLRKGARLPTELIEGRRVIEDVITSTLFGPLKFMDANSAGQILSWFSRRKPESHAKVRDVQFWPRFQVDERSANEYTIEPDLVIDGYVDNEAFRWIIEVKWDAMLHLQQVQDQVRICSEGQRDWVHISLVKSADLASFECADTIIIQWNQVLSALQEVIRSGEAKGSSSIWCKDAVAFLEKLGIGAFEGFDQLGLVPVAVEEIDLHVSQAFFLSSRIEVEQVAFSLNH
ncbi:hypothetical protein LQG66_30375 [Bradyrhizobium ontarionense]|uniref:TnsA endonuclease N-terminal domain-containing protein n=1 Tax=Bradyrhizobium ontarionense TaxID=2898149 RepID=A0ABY3R9P5_9BRAD|nr:hypothetical protein [Bradyrhizobium sp. A19]UFZ03487.1 hypothetical protein LQG66_30375 [Bradyrhizobium sp. A19]